MKRVVTICAVVLLAGNVVWADPSWETFVIRNSNSGGVAPTITDLGGGWLEFDVDDGGQKAGWGTNSMNGRTIGEIASVSITRAGGATGWGPYMNLWVTDGLGGYAVLANEPSHPWEYTPGTAYDVIWDVLKDATTWVYEVSSTQGFALPDGTTIYSSMGAGSPNPFSFGDFADYAIATPASHWGGTGAPDDLNAGTYTAYGFNWVFGDTGENYTDVYEVSNPTLVAVPVPGALLLAMLGLAAAGTKLRRKNA
jgi:hypothetical protein